MFIFGSKLLASDAGRVADYCVSCECARAFRVYELRKVSHIYFISTGRGSKVGYVRRCEVCNGEWSFSANKYKNFSYDRQTSLEELVDLTNPDLPQEIVARVDLYQRIGRGELSSAERLTIIEEALLAVAPYVESIQGFRRLDLRSVLALLSVPALFIIGSLAGEYYDNWVGPSANHKQGFAILGLMMGLAWLIHSLITSPRRYFENVQLDRVVSSLSTLKPTFEEIDTVREDLRQKGLRIGRVIKPEELRLDIEAASQA